MTRSRNLTLLLAGLLLAIPTLAEDATVDPSAAFDRLKTLTGTWNAVLPEETKAEMGAAAEGYRHTFALAAGGTVVMERMGPDTDHEMINMYHLDGDDLVLTHYCAGGNQPTMKLDRDASTADDLHFVFTGGTNLDPAVDEHIHDARVVFAADGTVGSHWTGYAGGASAGEMAWTLERATDD